MIDTTVDTKARTGDAEETLELARAAATLTQNVFSASRTLQMHALENRASQQALERLESTLRHLGEIDGRVTLRVSTDLLMVNDLRVVVDSQSMGPVVYLVEAMKRRRTEQIDIDPDVDHAKLGGFLQVFFREYDYDDEDVFGTVRSAVSEACDDGVRLLEWIDRPMRLRDSAVGRKEIREESNKLYSRAVLFTGEVLRNVEQQRAIPVPKAVRLTQQIVDIIQVDESILVGLASIKSHDAYTFAHSANVAVLSMLIADRIGIPRADVAQVGLAALVHDIGKTHVPHDILNKNGSLSEDEWAVMKNHTVFGALELSRSKALRAVGDAIFVALQHHVRFNGEGYPAKPGGWSLLPVSRIVTVADYFDAMTTPRVYRTEPMTPDKALRYILDHSGSLFDPFIARTFIQVMGLYPVGTVVELDDGQRAVVVRQNAEPSLMHRPVVSPLAGGDSIDLAEVLDDGTYRCSVRRTLYDPDAEQQKSARFLAE